MKHMKPKLSLLFLSVAPLVHTASAQTWQTLDAFQSPGGWSYATSIALDPFANLLALSSRASAAIEPGSDIAQRIKRGESFLTNLFDTRLGLLPE